MVSCTRLPVNIWSYCLIVYYDLFILGFLILNTCGAVTSPPVRRASADVVSVVAKHAVPAGEWPELLPFLHQCSQSVQEDHREVRYSFYS